MSTWLLFNIHLINFWYAVGGLILLAVTTMLLFEYMQKRSILYGRFFATHIWGILTLVLFGGVATTLLYSEVFGFVPCSLCWLQRVALYPQLLLVVSAYKLKDTIYFPMYGIILSAFGFLVAVYQYIYQALPQELHDAGLVPCLADGTSDCADKIMEVFGFVTFPFLSAVLFAFLIVVYLYMRKENKK